MTRAELDRRRDQRWTISAEDARVKAENKTRLRMAAERASVLLDGSKPMVHNVMLILCEMCSEFGGKHLSLPWGWREIAGQALASRGLRVPASSVMRKYRAVLQGDPYLAHTNAQGRGVQLPIAVIENLAERAYSQ